MQETGGFSLRRANARDARACHDLLWESITDLGRRQGTPYGGTAEQWWQSAERLQTLLSEIAAEWWVAERPNPDGTNELIGFARSIERGDLFELTEFFVRPGSQSNGVGRALLERAFPPGRGALRSIVATTDVRARARYYAAGTAARLPIYTLSGAPSADEPSSGSLTAVRIDGAAGIAEQRTLERELSGFVRGDAEMEYLLSARRGHLYRRGDAAVGFGFVGQDGAGPIAAVDPADLPAILLHVEAIASTLGIARLEIGVPGPADVAIRHLTSRGFRFEAWFNVLMSDRPFGQFDRFLPFNPPSFL